MGGDIKVFSEEEKGSSFIVTLELPQSVQAIEDPKYATTLLQPLNYQSANVLVVEDNQINQVIVQTQLTYLGVTSDLVNDGQQASTSVSLS